MQGAGGVSGLLWIEDLASTTTHLACMVGNGNVTTLVNATTQQATARYEYGSFGDLIRQSGSYAAINPYKFSKKYTADETSLLDYGYRYYNPMTGRWPSRDPIMERQPRPDDKHTARD
jgi:RHS repeat-associated protein